MRCDKIRPLLLLGAVMLVWGPAPEPSGAAGPKLAELRVRFVDALTGEPVKSRFALYGFDLPPNPKRSLPKGDERIGIYEATAKEGARVQKLLPGVRYGVLSLDAAVGFPMERLVLKKAVTNLTVRIPVPRRRLVAVRIESYRAGGSVEPVRTVVLERGGTAIYSGFRDPSWLKLRWRSPAGNVPGDSLETTTTPVESPAGLYHVPFFSGDSRCSIGRSILTFEIENHAAVFVNPGDVLGPVVDLHARTAHRADILKILRRPDGSPVAAREVTIHGRVKLGQSDWTEGRWIARNRVVHVDVWSGKYKTVKFEYPVDGRRPAFVRLKHKKPQAADPLKR